jgi:ligand-binding sensor domain-containing protein/signal transduction histidine kinase
MQILKHSRISYIISDSFRGFCTLTACFIRLLKVPHHCVYKISSKRNSFGECICVIALLLSQLCSYAQSGKNPAPGETPGHKTYIIDNWDTEKGLPSNSLLSLFQSSEGFIWISSYQGVLRFDGSEFVQYNKTNTPSFQTTGISTIAEDKQKRLWFGTYGGGILTYSNSVFRASPEEIRDQTIGALYVDGDEVLVGTRGHGLYCYRNDTLKQVESFAALKDVMISAITRDPANALWIGTENKGIVKIVSGKVSMLTTQDGLPDNKITSFFTDSQHRLWIGTSKGIVLMESGQLKLEPSVPSCLVKNIAEDQHGNLWAASECGLFIRRKESTKWVEFRDDNSHQLANNIVDVLPSIEGDVWVTTYRHGLFRIRYSSFSTINVSNGLSAPIVTAVSEISPGRFLIGTDNGKVDIVEHGQVKPFRMKKTLPETRIRHFLRDRRQNIWIGTSGGLLKISPSGKEEWLTKETGLSDNLIRVLFEDRDGAIWIGTRTGGITRIDEKGQFTYLNKESGFPSDFIMSIDQSKDGAMWIGSNESGLFKISNDKVISCSKEDGLPSNVIFNTFEDSEGTLWFATNGGLVRLKNKTFFTYDGRHGLPNDAPYDVLEDAFGNLWLPSTLGIMKISRKNLDDVATGKTKALEVRLYDRQDGIEEPECTGTTESLRASDGTMWIPTLDGIILIDAEKLPQNDTNVKVYIDYLAINDEKLLPSDHMELQPGVKRLSFKYSALNLKAPTKVKFRFKLENFDNQWIEVGSRKEVFFTNLSPGAYRLLISARNEDGKWSENITQLNFLVLPYFHQTPMFYFMVVVAVGVFVFGIFRWRTYSIKARNEELSNLVVHQTEELRSTNAALADQKEEVERTNEELLAQHSHLAEANIKLEQAHVTIKTANEELLRSNQHLEVKVKERTHDLQTAIDKVSRLNEELAVFIYRASHDLKGPTASLIGLALLGKMEGGVESQRYFERIENTAVSMNKVLSKLINIHGAITRKDLTPEPVVIPELVRDAQHSALGNGHDSVVFKLDCNIHQTINCDGTLLRIILENLIENAMTFSSPDRNLEINCIIRKTNQEISIVLEDNGLGIEKENYERVFDLFFRASENSKGNGLGLYLVKKAVEKLNGRIKLESEVNQYTRFIITFPESVEIFEESESSTT